jgi:MFS transporter, DHA1 family, multidrug resistance protein
MSLINGLAVAASSLLPANAPSAQPHAAPALISMLAMLLALQPWATDLYLPALPSIATSFSVDALQVQWTLLSFILVFALAQLGVGPLSDRIGRRPVLIGGLVLFVMGSALALVSYQLGLLIVARIMQALGVCCTVVCARAIVRDLYEPQAGPRVLAKVSSVMALAPLSGPLVGALALSVGNWRTCFLVLTLVGIAALGWIALSLPETNQHKNPQATQPQQLWRNYADCFADAQFRAYLIALTGSYCMVFSFLSGSSFVLIKVYGYSSIQYGLLFCIATSGYMLGTFVMRRLARTMANPALTQTGALFALLGGAIMLSGHTAGGPMVIGLAMFVGLIGHGMVQPSCQMGAVASFPKQAGAAVALSGFVIHTVAAPVGFLINAFFDQSAYPMALAFFLSTCLTFGGAWFFVRKLPALVKPAIVA